MRVQRYNYFFIPPSFQPIFLHLQSKIMRLPNENDRFSNAND